MKAQSETVSIKVLVFPSLILLLTIKCFIDNLNLCSQSVFAPHITTFCLSQGKHFHHHAYLLIHAYVCVLATQSCPILQPHDCRLPGSSVHGISRARILEQVAIPFSRGSSRHRAYFLPPEPPGKPSSDRNSRPKGQEGFTIGQPAPTCKGGLGLPNSSLN